MMKEKPLKRYNLKDFHVVGEKDTEIEITKEQLKEWFNDVIQCPEIEKLIVYLNEKVKP